MHERLGRHTERDATILFYQTSENMSADIYTKAFKDKPGWQQAQRLINSFAPSDLTPQRLLDWMLEREAMSNDPAEDVDNRAGWSKASKRRNGARGAAAAVLWEIVD